MCEHVYLVRLLLHIYFVGNYGCKWLNRVTHDPLNLACILLNIFIGSWFAFGTSSHPLSCNIINNVHPHTLDFPKCVQNIGFNRCTNVARCPNHSKNQGG